MLNKTLKDLFGHSIIYSLPWISSSLVSIILLPVYTRYLTRADYGILEILEYTNSVLRIILIAGFHTALAKFFNEENNLARKKIIISTGMFFVFVSGGIGSLIGISFNDNLAYLLLGNRSYTNFVNLNIAILYADLIVLISTTYFIVSKKPKIYLVYSLSRLILSILAVLYFVVVMKLGALGMLYGNLLSTSILAIIIAGHNIFLNGIKVCFSILRGMLLFGLPVAPAMLCATVMHNADRFLIRYYCSLADVGIYGLGYKFPYMLNALILQSFSYIWSGSTMYEIAKQPDSRYQYAKITTYFMALFLFAQLSLSVFSVSVVKILADQKFFLAHQVIPLVSFGLCFHAFYTFFTVGAFIKSKTWLLILSYLPAAVVNIIGNIVFLPKYGYMAAAWVSIVTYFVFAVTAYLSCRGILNIPFEFKRLTFLFLVPCAIYLISSYFNFENLLLEIFKGAAFIMLFVGLLVFGGWFTKGEKEFLKDKYAHLRRSFFKVREQGGFQNR